jgi:uncharacterized protein
MVAMAATTVALAIWVKTPELSPVKTRLASALGQTLAVALYEDCVSATAEVAGAAARLHPALQPLWAVAEVEALQSPRWQTLPGIDQGDGTLGERLARVYRALIDRHAAVLFIGADAPQVDPVLLADAARRLGEDDCDFLLGRAVDGGFWLFGGRLPLPDAVWTRIAYSRADTAAALAEGLRTQGRLHWLPMLQDLDQAADIGPLISALRSLKAPLPAQRALLDRLRAANAAHRDQA